MREPAPGLRPHERIASVPLGRLELSPDNARRTPANDAALAELKASIAAHGLLENLVVRPQGGEGAAARYAVIAGGRSRSAAAPTARPRLRGRRAVRQDAGNFHQVMRVHGASPPGAGVGTLGTYHGQRRSAGPQSAIGLGRNTQPDASAVRSSSASPATDATRYTVAGSSPSSRSDLEMKWTCGQTGEASTSLHTLSMISERTSIMSGALSGAINCSTSAS